MLLRLLFGSLATSLVCACGGAQSPRAARPDELRVITEGRATALIGDTLREQGMQPTSEWEIVLADGARLPVDVRLGDGRFGIEWVSGQDRVDFPEALPDPAPDGQLRIVAGAGDDSTAQVLVLDAETYRYDPDRVRVQYGARGLAEAEGRLRRDIQDFVEYARGNP